MQILAIKAPSKDNPLIPKKASDPAGQMPTVKRLFSDLKKRFNKINKRMVELVKEQRKYQTRITTNKAYYEYQIDELRYQSINEYILRVLRANLLESFDGTKPLNWFYQSYLEQSFIDGINDQVYSAKSMADPAIVGEEITQQIMAIDEDYISPQQQQRLGLVYARVFEEMDGLTNSMKVDLANTLTRGMADGLGITEISKNIQKRVQVGFSRAQRIARTEIMQSYRTATRSEQRDINANIYADSDWHMQLLWWSALTSTTRKTHAAKHGGIYDNQEVDDFYSEGANAINCYCNQGPVLVNKKTGETPQQDLIDKMLKQKQVWRVGMKGA